jgi:DNA processing protein
MGVDAVAHKTTVENHGMTIAVLGCGVDCCNPATNQYIYSSILANDGVIVSEYPLSEPPSIGSFPSRNRIIAGLSHGVVVTEGAADSGALITAKDAVENGRKIFAVPGPITSHLSHGPNELIKAGAIMVTSGADILTELGIKGVKSITGNIVGETKEEQKIIDVLLYESLGMDDIVRKTHLSSSQVSVILSLFEMRGIVMLHSDGSYALV